MYGGKSAKLILLLILLIVISSILRPATLFTSLVHPIFRKGFVGVAVYREPWKNVDAKNKLRSLSHRNYLG